MKIINLIEDTAGRCECRSKHGLSFYIETKKHKILSDLGPGEETLCNADALGIDLRAVDTVILSHGHYDHADGILPFSAINPDAAIYIRRTAGGEYYHYDRKTQNYRYIGIQQGITDLEQIVRVDGDLVIDDELSLFGDLTGCMTTTDGGGSETHGRIIPGIDQTLMVKHGSDYESDDFSHEQCLVIQEDGRHVLLSGCAHSGILNILDRYEQVYGSAPDIVISGFHLMKKSEYTDSEKHNIRTIAEELQKYPTQFYTCHCTGIPAFEMMKEILGDQLRYVHCGEEIRF